MRLTAAVGDKKGRGNSKAASIPASIKGWDKVSSVAAMPPDHAVRMDNFIPRPGYIEPRRGSDEFATDVGDDDTAVETIMSYNAPVTGSSKLFAVGDGTIYDITGGGVASATTVTGLSNSRMQFTMFTNSSGTAYLVAANGINTPQIYNGTVWAAMSLTGVTPSDIIQPCTFKGRLFFCFNSSLDVGYMTIGAISGAVSLFKLGSFFSRGGYINCIATWTVDTRQTVNEYIAFITSRGQVAVYEGTDPSDADLWQLVGLYDIGAPIGRRCFLRIAGNLIILCKDGALPMTEMLSTDRGAAARASITSMIMNAMADAARNYYGNFGWQFIEYPRGTLAIMNIPIVENSSSVQYVMNTLTGAWCQFLGLDSNCWETDWNDNIYFGGNDGTVYQWDIGSGDGDTPIVAQVETAFNYFGVRGRNKRFTEIRPLITTDGTVVPGIGINVNFGTGAPVSIPETISTSAAIWDVALWDDATWPVTSSLSANWTTVDGIGTCASIITTVSTSQNGTQNGVLLQLNGWDMTYEVGGFI